MQRILILFAHPAFETPPFRRRLAEAAAGLPGACSPQIESPVDDLSRPAMGSDAEGSQP